MVDGDCADIGYDLFLFMTLSLETIGRSVMKSRKIVVTVCFNVKKYIYAAGE